MKLIIKNLKAGTGGQEILKGVNLQIRPGEIHVLMGPNGSGKSTLAQVIAGHPSYKVDGGQLTVDGKDIGKLTPDKRARVGIFLGFQHPVEVPGVSVFNMLRRAKQAIGSSTTSRVLPRKALPPSQSVSGLTEIPSSAVPPSASPAKGHNLSRFRQELLEYASSLKLGEDFLRRSLNEGFSGGEKKRNEILQMMALAPKLVILDEIDSGLDIDGLKVVASAIEQFIAHSPQSSVILITHYARILKYLKPDFVHVMVDGKIVKSGKMNLAKKIEERGYNAWQTV
ncbi:MAG: ATP-binding cassette domain-containing protein [Patescibacteria group bacterium]